MSQLNTMWLITNQWSSLELATRGVNVIFTISSAFSFLKAPKAVKIKYLLKHYYKWVLKLGMLVYKDHHFIMSVKAIGAVVGIFSYYCLPWNFVDTFTGHGSHDCSLLQEDRCTEPPRVCSTTNIYLNDDTCAPEGGKKMTNLPLH